MAVAVLMIRVRAWASGAANRIPAATARPAPNSLVPVMRNGQPLETPTPLIELRQRVTQEVARLPEELKKPEPAQAYPVDISPGLRALAAELDRASN